MRSTINRRINMRMIGERLTTAEAVEQLAHTASYTLRRLWRLERNDRAKA